MNNAIKLNTRSYNSERDIISAVVKILAKGAVALYTVFCFAVYAAGYMLNEVRKFTGSKTAKGMVIFYELFLRMWVHAGLFVYMAIAVFGAMAGLMAVALCIPVLILRIIVLSVSLNSMSKSSKIS